MNSRKLAVLGVTATIGLAVCGGDSDDGASEPAASTPPPVTTTESAESKETETETETTETTESASSGEPTPGGTKLAMGEPATIAYEDSSKPNRKSLIEVTPKSIEKGSIDDFANIDLDAEQKAATPYYVKVAV
ncbi:MAG: hypothetical protein ABIO51_03890, partial [Solirubrobacteraceae bacterium]